MKIFTSVASATALLASMAFTQAVSVKSSPAAQPALRPAAAKGVRSIKGTQDATAVVTAANAFIATLTSTQQTTLLQTFNSTNVLKWSNLPCGAQCRIGLQLSNLTSTQQAAALAVVQAATGTTSGDGYNEIQQIRAADDYLNTNGGGAGYGSGLYFIAFLGTPSATGTWMLQFGGHHLATNITYGNGIVTGATPKFEGVEPLSFTTTNANIFAVGTTVAPMSNEASTMLAMLNGLTSTQKTTAKLTTSYSDVVLGPGSDGKFPTTSVGLQCSQLTSAQQDLVMAAMAPWVNDSDDASAAALLSAYKAQLATTYVSYAGTGNFTTQGDYVRIDGPNVWIEFVCQNGVVFQNQIHYHSIWRDRARDYGGNFYGNYTTVLGTKEAAAATVFGLFPSPILTGNDLQVRLATASAGTYTVRNLLGQTLATGSISGSAAAVPTTNMVPGVYLLTVESPSRSAVTSRFVVQ